jgi:hypothetical protein
MAQKLVGIVRRADLIEDRCNEGLLMSLYYYRPEASGAAVARVEIQGVAPRAAGG